jgi:hypothetical protein
MYINAYELVWPLTGLFLKKSSASVGTAVRFRLSKSRKVLRPAISVKFSWLFLDRRTNAELVLQIYVALHSSPLTLPKIIKILAYSQLSQRQKCCRGAAPEHKTQPSSVPCCILPTVHFLPFLLPSDSPRLQPTFPRRTSGYRLWIFTAVKFPNLCSSPPLIMSLVPLTVLLPYLLYFLQRLPCDRNPFLWGIPNLPVSRIQYTKYGTYEVSCLDRYN